MNPTEAPTSATDLTLRLTDDELAALDAVGPDGWLPALPTVDADDADGLAGAVFRGRRSLAARGLLPGFTGSDPSPAETAAEMVALARGSGHRIEVYLAGLTLSRVSWHRSSFHYRALEGSGWLFHSVVPVGLHSFGLVADTEQQAYLRGLIEATFDRGPTAAPEEGQAAWLCLVSLTPASRHVVLVRGGDLRGASDAHDGTPDELLASARPLTGPAAALEALLAGATHSLGG